MTPAEAEGPRRGPRLAWITAAALSAVLVVVPATWQVWSWGSGGSRSDTLRGGSDGRPVTALEIVGGDADITVTPRADHEVGYRATVSWSLKAPTIEESRLGDTLRLTPHCPGDGFWPGAGAGCSVRLAVTVPVDIPVKVTTRSGRIALSGLGGSVDTEADSGRVEIVGLRGPLRAKVGSGHLHATGLASDRAEIRVGSGRAEATFVTPPDEVTARVGSGRLAFTVPEATRFKVRCEAGSGRCEVPDALRDAASPRGLDIETGSGRAQAGYPDGPWATPGES
ncbi:hypothetical protein Snoj_09310 [Streptomyces nojiriensis]|uniref:Adhesin domain-containing protein n=1 Tax=Streptomyces nojiriensis TaxID=66374 RepID=A0ABQ3SFU4_9ACTN|nr:hypothetical protein [Streptomyces nojiriensis]QTI48652.1 hypothetical protein JYK04_06517 [Streptomyces nojiriensis]GGS27057.1 hypothetical protein GCM10010205_66160 [Streptomyces nojiriensis]GHI67013.1 hypothetical protein Snoj_09310 [Streptomyces nojiriensis]